MTVNDLKPAKLAPAAGGAPGESSTMTSPVAGFIELNVTIAAPLRVEKLREILEASLEEFVANLSHFSISGAAHSESLGSVSHRRPSMRDSTDDPTAPPSRPPPPPPNESLEKQLNEQATYSGYAALASKMFRPLEEYIQSGFGSLDCLNTSFVSHDDRVAEIMRDKGHRHIPRKSVDESIHIPLTEIPGERETLMLMVGRAVRRERANSRVERGREKPPERRPGPPAFPGLDWDAVREFYDLLLNPTRSELAAIGKLSRSRANSNVNPADQPVSRLDIHNHDIAQIELALNEARINMIRILLKSTETLLKRPGRPLKSPDDMRFLLVILANPLLSPGSLKLSSHRMLAGKDISTPRLGPPMNKSHTRTASAVKRQVIASGPANHSGIVKRLFGLLSNLPNECHHYLVTWFSLMAEKHFRNLLDICGSFTTYRISRQDGKPPARGAIKGRLPYGDDWQVKAVARLMSLLDKANNSTSGRRKFGREPVSDAQAMQRGQIVPSSSFYSMRLDYCDIIADFEAWESKSVKFCFCQYPFYLSMGAKIQILEHDARRQMEVQARNAFYTNISARTTLSQYMVLRVRRDCLVEDSLKGISESVGTVEDIKKGLKVEFVGEDGIDGGGLKKEWFLMVAREVFDANHGMC